MSSRRTTRLAPSPTGALHLGNARTFLLNWLLARQRGWRVLFRMEDLDGPRVKAGADQQAVDNLCWLGLDWDGPVTRQSDRGEAYQQALRELIDAGWAYPCTCSRQDIEQSSSAPHVEDGVAVYPGTCRSRWDSPQQAREATGRPVAWRARVTDRPISFDDAFAGRQTYNLSRTCGDFVVLKNDGLAAYQLAVVVDDAATGVDAIVRGADLLESTARQLHLRRRLGLDGEVTYWHLPLVIGEDGRRLAKRHGDTRLATYIEAGVPRQRVLGLLAWWSGQIDQPREISLDDLLSRFDAAAIPHEPVVFTTADNRWLRGVD
ncbi:MAG: tRNA glutamyl-Q(34) synthetase GluQRS [Planctomycetes bacterium]|nr:tRNA glutamyl-Q(34) synthetase GluQRS [Phycisphaerae bacterium]NBB94722.1 tRNA glutamyl-Q(34) synthetase GluQRS [Planctomycetota bacterium]